MNKDIIMINFIIQFKLLLITLYLSFHRVCIIIFWPFNSFEVFVGKYLKINPYYIILLELYITILEILILVAINFYIFPILKSQFAKEIRFTFLGIKLKIYVFVCMYAFTMTHEVYCISFYVSGRHKTEMVNTLLFYILNNCC